MGSINAIAGTKVYLDANVFIYAVEGFAGVGAKLTTLFQRFDRRRVAGGHERTHIG